MRRLALVALALAASPLVLAQIPDPIDGPVPRGAYELDKSHTSLLFRVSHIGFSSFTGRFTRIDAKLDFDPKKLASSRVDVVIDPTSIAADNVPADFLSMLAGQDWLDAARHPELTFRSRRVEAKDGNTFRIHGDITMNGVTRPIVLDARYNGGYAAHPLEPRARIGFSAKGSLRRSDFGVSAGLPAPGTTFGVGDEVEIVLEAEFSGPAHRVTQR
ncbi:MAG: polyisoprenoid-binding protein [Steroidobacteraceae bacterium]|nr:polyisoprenoid-binding protein [Steroidobacteraceae bacterium]